MIGAEINEADEDDEENTLIIYMASMIGFGELNDGIEKLGLGDQWKSKIYSN